MIRVAKQIPPKDYVGKPHVQQFTHYECGTTFEYEEADLVEGPAGPQGWVSCPGGGCGVHINLRGPHTSAVQEKLPAISQNAVSEFKRVLDIAVDQLLLNASKGAAPEAAKPSADDLPHPMQPIVWVHKVVRFRENAAVRALVDHGQNTGLDLNRLAGMKLPKADLSQLAQLMGYSVSGYGDLSYRSKRMVKRADAEAARLVDLAEGDSVGAKKGAKK